MRYTEKRKVIPMEVFYDISEMPASKDIESTGTSFRKPKQTEYLKIIPKRKRYYFLKS